VLEPAQPELVYEVIFIGEQSAIAKMNARNNIVFDIFFFCNIIFV
jgi:hypothetical protein